MLRRTDRPDVALCHEWVTTYGGSEIVAGRLAAALGITDVYTFTANPELAARVFPRCNVRTVQPFVTRGAGSRRWPWLLPVMAAAWKKVDLRRYRAVVTSSHACVNSVRVPSGTPHISYCHTPMRYAWEWRSEVERVPRALRPAWPFVASILRRQDRRRAANVTHFVANSRYVADRIRRYYRREATVVYPPVDLEFWVPGLNGEKEDFYLLAGRLVAYKRSALAVDAATRLSLPFVVAGAGPELPRLKSIAGPSVTFVERPSDAELRDLYRRARALVFPGVEDFGMTMVEAQACGTPVLALARGGALEAVVDGVTGMLYEDATAEGLAGAMSAFDPAAYASQDMRDHVQRFHPARFDTKIKGVIEGALRESRCSFAADDLSDRTQEDLDV